jgi:nucleotide-binding universal stress UspA family protein
VIATVAASGYGRAMVSTIAVGIDGSATAARAVDMAVEIARHFDAELVLLSALSDASASSDDLEVDTVELDWATNPSARVRQTIASTQDRLAREGVRCTTLIDEGEPGDVLVRLAEQCGADILVVGNKGMQRRVLGSVPNTVAHKAPCSVLVVKTT